MSNDSTPQNQRSVNKYQYLLASEARRILVRLLNEGKTIDNFFVRLHANTLSGIPIEVLRHLEEIYPKEMK